MQFFSIYFPNLKHKFFDTKTCSADIATTEPTTQNKTKTNLVGVVLLSVKNPPHHFQATQSAYFWYAALF